MRRRVLGAAGAMAALLTGGCGSEAVAPVPTVPPVLVQHPEPPISTSLNVRLVRASQQALERLEPEWGHFRPTVYTADPANRARIAADIRAGVPAGWTELDLADQGLSGAELLAFSNGKRLFAALIVDPVEGSPVAVLILRNKALVESMDARR